MAALDKAGRVAEFGLALEAELDPAVLRPGIQQAPAEQLCTGRHGEIVERGLDHRRASIGSGLARPCCQHAVSRMDRR
jgi:hypothetical protein